MMRYSLVVVLACLALVAGQDTLRGFRSDLNRIASVEKEADDRNLEMTAMGDGPIDEIAQLEATIAEEESTLQAMEEELDQEEAQVAAEMGVLDTGAVDLLDEVPPEDEFEFYIGITPKRPCLQRNIDQVLLAMFRVGFMDLDACFDKVKKAADGSRRLTEEDEYLFQRAERLLEGKYKFVGGGCRRCRGKKKKKRGGKRRLEKTRLVDRNLQVDNESPTDPLGDLKVRERMSLALKIAIEETFGENEDNCLFGTTIDDVDFDLAFGMS